MTESVTTKSIFKSVITLGSSQGLIVICSLVRAKIVAILLGPAATGLFAIFNSVVDVVGGVTRLDLRRVAQREISKTGSHGVIEAVLKTSWMLGLTGGVIMIVLSPLISELTFANIEMTPEFASLGVALIALSLQEGYYSVMTGCHDMKRFAVSQVLGSVAGLIVSIPLFIYWGLNSIVPSIIVYSVSSALVARSFVKRELMSARTMRWKDAIKVMMPALKFGGWLTGAVFVTRACDYCFVAWMTNRYPIETVGIYSAGSAVITRGAGLILSVLAADFYTRISAVSSEDINELNDCVGRQIRVLLSVVVPCLVLFVVFDSLIVEVLYSADYLPVVPYFAGATASVVLKIASWTLAFVILSRGAGKIYLFSETLSGVTGLVINIVSFEFGGMQFLGYAMLVNEIIYLIIVSSICRRYGVCLRFKYIAAIVISAALIFIISALI